MAVASGSRGLEAAVVLTEADEPSAADLAVLRDFAGAGVVVHRGDPRGTIQETTQRSMTTYTACLVDVYDTALSVDMAQ